MSQCTKCSSDIYDFEELKYGLCWDCISKNENLIDGDSDIGEIKDNEVINDGDSGRNEKYSVQIRSRDGSSSTVSELDKSKMSEGKSDSSKPKKTTTVNKKKKTGDKKVSQDEIDPGTNDETKPPPTTEPKPIPAPKKSDNDEGEQKLIRESKETITKSSRAKTRAFSLINQAMKETGVFDVSATVDGKLMTVASLPYKERNIEDIVMTTTMEVLDAETTLNKKKR
jgi:hypothetical protein